MSPANDKTDHLATFSSCHPVIFLLGYRGTGKTTVARLLAQRLGWDWLDADERLEKQHGRTIRQIFAEEGEAGFRAKEALQLDELRGHRRHVISTGGGIVLRPENRQKLKTSGKCVWLTADPATIWRRINADASTAERRPNLTVGGLAEIEQLLHIREPFYRECADLIVPTMDRTPEEVAEIIDRWLAERGASAPC
jgi:shikimate kinase